MVVSSKIALVVTLSGTSLFAGTVESVSVPVAEDESVISNRPDQNYANNLVRGGLFTGVDGGFSGASHFYLKFHLPDFDPASSVLDAKLVGFWFDEFAPAQQDTHGIHFVAYDGWTELNLTWANQPGPAYGTAQAMWETSGGSPGEFVSIDLTNIADQEYRGDGTLSVMFKASNESMDPTNRNWQYFVEHEADPERAFRLEITLGTVESLPPDGLANVGEPVNVIPLPPAAWGAAGMLGILVAHRLGKRMHAMVA